MPTVLCPLPTNPPHEHELLTSKKSVPYVRCDVFQSHLYFRSDLAKGWLAEHAESGGTIENPSPKKDDFFSGEISPEEARENPQDVEEESVLAKAARMTNEERARFIEERQRKIDRMLQEK